MSKTNRGQQQETILSRHFKTPRKFTLLTPRGAKSTNVWIGSLPFHMIADLNLELETVSRMSLDKKKEREKERKREEIGTDVHFALF